MELTFLGTSGMQPTKERNPSAALLSYRDEGILFDCGEGTQRQMRLAGIPITKVTKICISHWHGDHVLGLPGLMQSLSASQYSGVLEIFGPPGTIERFHHLFKGFVFDSRLRFKVQEVESGVFSDNPKFLLETRPLEHNTPCQGYCFVEKDRRRIDVEKVRNLGIPQGPILGKLQRGEAVEWKGKMLSPEELTYVVPGKKVCYVVDTRMTDEAVRLAEDADILVCEATFDSSFQEKAEEYAHLTGKDAGLIASRADVKRLILTHFSARYISTEVIEKDATSVFQNVSCAKDFMRVEV